jgi:hypothetical protein
MGFPSRIKPPTPEEVAIVVWLLIALTEAIGIVALYFSTQADLPEQTLKFRGRGIISLSISFGIWLGWKLLRFFVD